MGKSRVFVRDSKKRVRQAPKKQTEVGERAGAEASSRASTHSPSQSTSRAASKSPKQESRAASKSPKQESRSASKSPKQESRSASKSPKQNSRSASKSPKREKKNSKSTAERKSPRNKKSRSKKKGSSRAAFSGVALPKKVLVLLIQIFVVFLALLGVFLAIYYLSPHYHLGLDIVPALGGDRLYYAADLSCYTLFGFKPRCTRFKYRWAEYGCDKRKNTIIVGGAFGGLGLIASILVLVLLFLLICHVVQLPIVAFIIAVVAAVCLVVAWIVVVVVYTTKMCPIEIEDEFNDDEDAGPQPHAMKEFTTIGPGFIFLLVSSILQVLSAILIFFWIRYLIV